MVAVSFGQLLGGTNNLTGDAALFKLYFPLIRDEPFFYRRLFGIQVSLEFPTPRHWNQN